MPVFSVLSNSLWLSWNSGPHFLTTDFACSCPCRALHGHELYKKTVSVQPCTDMNIDVRETVHGHFFALHGQNVSIYTYARTHICGARIKFVSVLSVS